MILPDPEGGGGAGAPAEDEATAEGTGETVGEAKWAAIRELERRFPGLDKAAIRFEVLAEGERGLLGVGFAPARVIAHVPTEAREGGTPDAEAPAPPPPEEPGSPAARLRELLERICAGLGVEASVAITESEGGLLARLSGRDVGLLIGKHGQTIDAIQYLANAVLWRESDERPDVVVDASGYRERRRVALERIADGAARDARQTGEPVALEPMTATERKIIHLYLQEQGGLLTSSEGTEPNRRIVVSLDPESDPGPDAA
jgi:spoIIIJ-associated protein